MSFGFCHNIIQTIHLIEIETHNHILQLIIHGKVQVVMDLLKLFIVVFIVYFCVYCLLLCLLFTVAFIVDHWSEHVTFDPDPNWIIVDDTTVNQDPLITRRVHWLHPVMSNQCNKDKH